MNSFCLVCVTNIILLSVCLIIENQNKTSFFLSTFAKISYRLVTETPYVKSQIINTNKLQHRVSVIHAHKLSHFFNAGIFVIQNEKFRNYIIILSLLLNTHTAEIINSKEEYMQDPVFFFFFLHAGSLKGKKYIYFNATDVM